jgi:hypothetical protein
LAPPPRNWRELKGHSQQEGFLQAARKEYDDLQRRGTFSVVPKPANTKLLPLLWVFTYKFGPEGFLQKHKARICVRGDLQQTHPSDDFYAATLAARTFRVLASITAAFDLEAQHFDAVNAFTNSRLDEPIYVSMPEGYDWPNECLKLLRALYGLRQSPKLWLKEFTKTLLELGFRQVPGSECLYLSDHLLLFFYVDDIVVLYRRSAEAKFRAFRAALLARYEMRELGDLKWFLNIRVRRDRSELKLWLCQDSYISNMASSFHLDALSHYPDTPMATDELRLYDGIASKQEIYVYQRRVGSLLYATTISRPDAARAANKLSEFLQNPGPVHLEAVNRAIAYVYSTRYRAILYSASSTTTPFLCASDAAYADDPVTRRSTAGYVFLLFGGPVDWKSTKQRTVTTSSTEAELLALSDAAKEMYSWRRFFEAIFLCLDDDLTIWCDNAQTIRLLAKETPKLVTRLRHVDIHQHWLWQEVQEGRLRVDWVSTADMPADGLTKALPRQKHEDFVRLLGLSTVTVPSQEGIH